MFQQDLLDRVVGALNEKREYEEQAARHRAEEAEARDSKLAELGAALRAFPLRVFERSLTGGEDLQNSLVRLQEENRAVQEAYAQRLVAMGLPADYTKPKIYCSLCQDSGFVGGKMCSCLKRAAVLEGYRVSGMGKILEKQRFDNFDLSFYPQTLLPGKTYTVREQMAGILEDCRNWAENFSPDSPSLLFIGGTGLGKTHLSSAIAGKVIEQGFDVVYESAPNVAAIFEKERFESEDNAVGTRRIFEAELLILDDLGTEPDTKANSSAFYRLINQRVILGGKPTIISTNLTSRALEKQYDTAILSRLLGEFQVKQFIGEDIRRAKLMNL